MSTRSSENVVYWCPYSLSFHSRNGRITAPILKDFVPCGLCRSELAQRQLKAPRPSRSKNLPMPQEMYSTGSRFSWDSPRGIGKDALFLPGRVFALPARPGSLAAVWFLRRLLPRACGDGETIIRLPPDTTRHWIYSLAHDDISGWRWFLALKITQAGRLWYFSLGACRSGNYCSIRVSRVFRFPGQ